MNTLITIIRLPIAVLATVLIISFLIAVFPIELVAVIVTFPFSAVFLNRSSVQRIYGEFPRSLRKIPEKVRKVWDWVASEEKGILDTGALIMLAVLCVIIVLVLFGSRR